MTLVETEAIRTERLALLPLRVDYAEEMAGVLSDESLYTFTGGTPPTVADLAIRYQRQLAGPPDKSASWHNWVLRRHDEPGLIGYVQATVSPSAYGLVGEIAWVVGTAWQGQGYAKEAARGLVNWLISHHVPTVIAHVNPNHAASAAVARAVGLTPTARLQAAEVRWRLHLRPTIAIPAESRHQVAS
ncbi:GNAT family N-acetyltransferase [Kribbella deserti]|uniref:GNAT family N-acetyltransferase n=1 Tax=Kribbella deserti TaxID=1926257 RepID=A0ABV6QCT4_9ACTN